MKRVPRFALTEMLEDRLLFSWSAYAQLVNQDKAATDFASITGAGQTVAVIDTGIDYTQTELGGGFGPGHKVIAGYDFLDNDTDPMDTVGHGTAVAGVIAANRYTVGGITYQGVAPGANLVALRVGNETDISNENIEKALKWVIKYAARYHITVVNLSLGSGSYTTSQTEDVMSAQFKTLHDMGIFVSAASGNSNDQQSGPISEDGIAFPAADPSVFAVGAVDSNDVITNWAQRGEELDLLAPGVNIVMPKLGGGFVTEDGTSFSSPYVAGTAALIKQKDPTALVGDIGSILMGSGEENRDGDNETGNTTGLEFSRLDIDAALTLTSQRVGKTSTFNLGTTFDTALDSDGVLHAAYYDTVNHDVRYVTRATDGLWSASQIVDSAGDVGAQLTLAVDTTGKAAIGYFDGTNTAVKYASFGGTTWSTQTIESTDHVGTYPSLAFDINGNAYLAYYKRSAGVLRLARLDRDAGTWSEQTVDGGSGVNVGTFASLDVGEAAVRSNGRFTEYDTTVAIAYADTTNGNLKYARLDVDDSSATWFISVVDDTTGVSNIDLDLHDGPLNSGLQAQIVYKTNASSTIKYAYRNTNWFTENVSAAGITGGTDQIYFDSSNNPIAAYYNSKTRTIYTATRSSAGVWTSRSFTTAALPISVALNERTGSTLISYLNTAQTSVFSKKLL